MSEPEVDRYFQTPHGVDMESDHAYADISFLSCSAGVRLRLAWLFLKAAIMAINPVAEGYRARALLRLRQEIKA